MGLTEIALVALVGGLVGYVSGVFGVGGGFLIVPALNVFIGIPMEYAVGASACQVLGPATTSLLARRIKPRDLQLPLVVTGGLFCGVVLAGLCLRWLTNQEPAVSEDGRTFRPLDLVLLSGYLVLLLFLLISTVVDVIRGATEKPEAARLARSKIPPMAQLSEFDHPVSLTALGWYGLVMGFISGMLGISGGLIVWPSLLYLWGLKTQRTIVVSLIMVWMISAQATIVHSLNGFIHLDLVIALLLGGTIGARLGTEAGVRMRPRQLKSGFAGLVVLAILMVSFKLASLLL